MQANTQRDDIVMILEEWGKWTRTGLDNIGYPSITPARKMYSMGDSHMPPNITDAEAMRVNEILAGLKRFDRATYFAIENRYRHTLTNIQSAKLLRVSKNAVQTMVESGIGYVAGQYYAVLYEKTACTR